MKCCVVSTPEDIDEYIDKDTDEALIDEFIRDIFFRVTTDQLEISVAQLFVRIISRLNEKENGYNYFHSLSEPSISKCLCYAWPKDDVELLELDWNLIDRLSLKNVNMLIYKSIEARKAIRCERYISNFCVCYDLINRILSNTYISDDIVFDSLSLSNPERELPSWKKNHRYIDVSMRFRYGGKDDRKLTFVCDVTIPGDMNEIFMNFEPRCDCLDTVSKNNNSCFHDRFLKWWYSPNNICTKRISEIILNFESRMNSFQSRCYSAVMCWLIIGRFRLKLQFGTINMRLPEGIVTRIAKNVEDTKLDDDLWKEAIHNKKQYLKTEDCGTILYSISDSKDYIGRSKRTK